MVRPCRMGKETESQINLVELKGKMRQESPPTPSETPTSDWMHPIKVKLGILRERSMNLSIYKVPNKLRHVNEEAYSPRIVSIGPFHQGKRDLLAMEEHKWRYMLSLVHRTPNPEKSLDECGKSIIELEEKARGCYAENIKFNKKELAEMLLVDGCFILELFLRRSLRDFVDKSDPIFNNAWMVPTLQHDLALLENQIPFFVLQNLYEFILPFAPKTLPRLFTALALFFFHADLSLNQVTSRGESIQSSRHLLDLLHNFYLPTSPVNDPKCKENWGFRHCATKLLEAGIQFEKSSTVEDRLLDVRFSNGVINIPPLSVGTTTESLLRNLIALEQCSFGSSHHITSYAILINGLIHSSADIELLQRKGIIINNLGRGEEVLPLINSICKEVVLKDFYFSKLCEEVNAYHKSWWQWRRHKASWKARWHRYVGALRRDYFSNPWRIISFVAAVLLLLLTGLQTFYTVRAYYPR